MRVVYFFVGADDERMREVQNTDALVHSDNFACSEEHDADIMRGVSNNEAESVGMEDDLNEPSASKQTSAARTDETSKYSDANDNGTVQSTSGEPLSDTMNAIRGGGSITATVESEDIDEELNSLLAKPREQQTYIAHSTANDDAEEELDEILNS